MNIFVDTSAFYALLDADDQNHAQAKEAWVKWVHVDCSFHCSNYILLESIALIQRRLGVAAVRRFQEDIIPLCHAHWIGPELHAAATSALLAANRRQISIVDYTSFELARRLGIRVVFTFDQHFADQGFKISP
ncbi:MAG: PIN domain-containing protein [Anaerolineae bacterium]|nr:PIN domain-containing protein [Anaerolineae bacterium]